MLCVIEYSQKKGKRICLTDRPVCEEHAENFISNIHSNHGSNILKLLVEFEFWGNQILCKKTSILTILDNF